MRLALALPLALVACTEATPKAQPPSAPVDAAASVAIPVSRPLPDAGVVSVPESKPTWKSVPKEQNGFYAVLDGLCSKLGAAPIGGDLVVHYGGTSIYAKDRSGVASLIALRSGGLEPLGAPSIDAPTGIAGRSLDDFWVADSTGSRSSEGAVLYRRLNGTWKGFQKDETNLHAWLDGGLIGTGGFASSNGEVWVEGSTTKPPASLAQGLASFPELAAFPTGEVTLFGRAAAKDGDYVRGSTWIARHWSPATKQVQLSLPWFSADDYFHILETAPDEIYAYGFDGIAMYDGTAWKLLGKPTKQKEDSITWGGRAAKGDLWIRYASGAVEHTTPTGLVAIPMPEPTASISGIDKGAPWAVGISGKLYKRANETWSEVKLPPPAFGTSTAVKAKMVTVGGADDAVVLTAYWEKGPGWTEPELHWMLLRTKPTNETMRCNEPDPENNNVDIGKGFQSWPPFATAECKTPFVVLARRSNAKAKTPKETDWRAIRGALKGHGDLGDGKLVEFVSGDRTFLGAKAKDVDSARKLASYAAAKDRIRPEVVCGEPPATTRDIALE